MVEACGWAEHRWDGVSGVARLLHTFSLPLRLTAGGAASRSRLIGADRLNFIYFFIYALRGRDAQHEHSFTLLAQLHRFWAAQQNHRPAAVCLVTSTNGTKRPWNQHSVVLTVTQDSTVTQKRIKITQSDKFCLCPAITAELCHWTRGVTSAKR